MLKRALPIAVFAALLVFLVLGLNRDPRLVPSPLVGKPLPAFELTTLRDSTASLGSAELRGQPVLLNVWASWCIGCAHEHEFLMRLAASEQVALYGLNWKDEREAARAWLRERGDPYRLTAFDPDGRIGIDLGVYGAPESFLLDRDATVVYKHVGPLDETVWEREFAPRLAEMGSG